MDTICTASIRILFTTLILMSSGLSRAQEFHPYDPSEDSDPISTTVYPAWSAGIGAGMGFPMDGFFHNSSPSFAFQLDGRARTGSQTHLRGVFRRQILTSTNSISYEDCDLGCFPEYDTRLNQYHLLLGWHTTIGDSQTNWLNIEAGPALVDWQREGRNTGSTSAALSLGLSYLFSLTEKFALDLGVNALVHLENGDHGDLWGTMAGINIGLNYH